MPRGAARPSVSLRSVHAVTAVNAVECGQSAGPGATVALLRRSAGEDVVEALVTLAHALLHPAGHEGISGLERVDE
jgi:hypothetical protein